MKRLGYKSKSEYVDQVFTERAIEEAQHGGHKSKVQVGSKAAR